MRTIRLLRPLRSINKVRGIRVIVSSLIESLPPLANVALFLFFIIILFGTFGLHLFNGIFEFRCRKGENAPADINTNWDIEPGLSKLCRDDSICAAGYFCKSPKVDGNNFPWDYDAELSEDINFNYYYTNFDNIWSAMFTIF